MIGKTVKSQYGILGTVIEYYSSFKELSNNSNHFISMNHQEWLDMQLIPFTKEELELPWVSVNCGISGAYITSVNKIIVINDKDENN